MNTTQVTVPDDEAVALVTADQCEANAILSNVGSETIYWSTEASIFTTKAGVPIPAGKAMPVRTGVPLYAYAAGGGGSSVNVSLAPSKDVIK